jgi:hypothetical protein
MPSLDSASQCLPGSGPFARELCLGRAGVAVSDLDQQLRQLFKEKEAAVGPPPTTALPLTNTIGAQPSHARPRKVRPLLQITAIAAAVALVVLGVNVLRSNVTTAPALTPGQTWADALGDVSPLTMPDTLPRLAAQTNLPTSVPSAGEDLPPLLDDLPGRALMTWYPAPASGCDVQGWERDTIDFYGVDGQWRRLSMTDLGLPDSSWPGCFSNGPGSLSPDGRWWAIGAKGLFVLLNLETGDLVTRESRAGWPGLWAQNSQQLATAGMKSGSLWQVPGVHLTDTPGVKESGIAWPLPDGGYVIDEDTRSQETDGDSLTLRYYTATGDLSKTRRVPTPTASDCSVEGGFVGDRVGMVCLTNRNEPHTFYVLNESSWRVEAALRVPDGVDAYPWQWLSPGLWALWTEDSVGLWQIDEGKLGRVLPVPDEPKSSKGWAFNQFGLAGDLVTD